MIIPRQKIWLPIDVVHHKITGIFCMYSLKHSMFASAGLGFSEAACAWRMKEICACALHDICAHLCFLMIRAMSNANNAGARFRPTQHARAAPRTTCMQHSHRCSECLPHLQKHDRAYHQMQTRSFKIVKSVIWKFNRNRVRNRGFYVAPKFDFQTEHMV